MGGIGPQSSSLSTRNSMAPLFGDFFSFKSGVHVSRLSTHRLKGINPEREKAYNVGRNRIFDSRHDLHVYNLERRKLAVRKDPLTLGELIPKTKHMIFSENPVKDYEAVIDPVSVENDISQEMSVINEYYYNSPMNGQKFQSVGSDGSEVVVKIDNAVSSPWDRTGTDIPAERRLKTKEGNSIFYGGRPDTDERVRWQGIDIFLSELKSGFKKGFKEIVEEENLDGSPKEVHVQMTYLVDSLTNPTVGLTKWRRLPLISQFVGDALDERDSLKWERKALEKAYRSHSPITLDVDGDTYKLTLKPIHAHTTISCFSELRKQIRRGTLSGTVLENDINRRAFRRLLRYYRHSGLNDPIANEIITKFRSSRYNSVNLPPHIRLTMVDMLARICGLPIVHHCKSVVDRTSVAAAVSVVNQMILEKKLPLKGTFEETIGGELYKELFLRALQTQLPVSIDVRSAVNEDGTLNRKRDFPGSNLRDGVFAAFGVIPLFPDRALRDITTYEKVSFFVKAFFVALFSLFIIGSPKWLEPTKTFDMNSFALSEDGARPLLCKAKHTCSAALNRKGATPGVKDREIFQRKLENIPEGFLSAQGLAALNLSLTHLTENHPIRKTISPAERFLPNKTENNFTEFAERTILLIDGRRMIDANSFPQNLTLENCRDIVVKTLQEAMPAEAIDLEGIRARFNIERKKQLVEATLLCPIYSEGNKLKFTVKCKLQLPFDPALSGYIELKFLSKNLAKNRLVDHLTELLTDGNPSFKTIPLPSSELKKIEKLAPENRTTIETDFNRTPIITLNKKLLYTNTKELDCGAERLAIMKAKIKDQAEGIEEREAYIGEICTQTGATYTLEQLMKKLFHLPDSPDQLSIPVRLSIVPAPRGIYNEVDFNTQSKEVVRHDYYEITLPSDKGNMDTIFGAIAITAIPFDPEKPGSIKYRFLPLKEFRDIASPSMLEKRKKGLLHRPYPISTLSSIAEDD